MNDNRNLSHDPIWIQLCSFTQSFSTSELTLRQLVSVYQSLLQAVCNDNQPAKLASPLLNDVHDEGAILTMFSSNCANDEDARKLLFIQYLLFQNKIAKIKKNAGDLCWSGLNQIILPILFSSHFSTKNINEELMEAILDAAFSSTCSEGKMDNANAIGFRGSLNRCSSPELSHWKSSCHVLNRTCKYVSGNKEMRKEAFIQITSKIIQGIELATASCSNLTTIEELEPVLKPMVDDLLSTLVVQQSSDDGDNECIEKIWTSLWTVYLKQPSQQPIMIILTTILCTLASDASLILERKLPLILLSGNEEKQKPLHHKIVWELIYTCINQGLSITKQRKSWLDERSGKDVEPPSSAVMSQLCRRRGLYLLRILIEHEIKTNATGKQTKGKPKNKNDIEDPNHLLLKLWNKYVACFETLEMELELHLIDQVWATVQELFQHCTEEEEENSSAYPPSLSLRWMSLLLAKSVTTPESPALRKLCLYRLLKGQAGILLTIDETKKDDQEETPTPQQMNNNNNKKKNQKSKQPPKPKKPSCPVGAPVSILTTDFMCNILFTCFDSLLSSVGWNIHMTEEGGKTIESEDMSKLLADFLHLYLVALMNNSDKAQDFFHRLWHADIVCRFHRKTIVHIFTCIETTLQNMMKDKSSRQLRIPVTDEMLITVAASYQLLFSLGSVVHLYQTAMLQSLATILEYSKVSSAKQTRSYPAKSVLQVLALYPIPTINVEIETLRASESKHSDEGETSWIDNYPALLSLRKWLFVAFGGDLEKDNSFQTISSVGSTIATAFVDGMLASEGSSVWDPKTGASDLERTMAKATVMLCTLPSTYSIHSESASKGATTTTASEMLWPAIHKGLSNVPNVILIASSKSTEWPKADHVARALLLLENGCKFRVLTGMGNGDLVMDAKTGQMMPPPPNIETMLSNGVRFSIQHVSALMKSDTSQSDLPSGGGSRSSDAKIMSSTFASIISLLQTLSDAYPSSMAISDSVKDCLKESLEGMKALASPSQEEKTDAVINEMNFVQHISLFFAALVCCGEIGKEELLATCSLILKLEFVSSSRKRRGNQAARSTFQYAKWGVLACLIPRLIEASSSKTMDINGFLESLFDIATDSVEATPANALVSLFNCVVSASRQHFVCLDAESMPSDSNRLQALEKVINAIFGLMEESENTNDIMYMMDGMCSLIFKSNLLLEEYRRTEVDGETSAPIRDAFRKLIEMAGTQKPHISRVVLSRICAGWLGAGLSLSNEDIGMAAIPYKADILKLLLHKEEHVDASSTNQSALLVGKHADTIELPSYTNETSISRGFLLVFLSKLPAVENISTHTLKNLLHPLIIDMLDAIKPVGSKPPMYGTTEYCMKMRGWQALCILSRFVTAEIAENVSKKAFFAMEKEMIHNQIRYFIEIFSLQCARRHPTIFNMEFIKQIVRRDLSLQMISSLMIIGGNLIVGRYEADYFGKFDKKDAGLSSILAGVVPWLSSTQGFSRAIAQLLAHKLIPLAIEVDRPAEEGDNDWYLKATYKFLDEHSEMRRLRKKQSEFFETYEADSVCTPEGVLSIPVDNGGESDPAHLVEVIKECLQEVYSESHVNDAPTWKQVEHFVDDTDEKEDSPHKYDDVVNFQRKIIPVDALNLALESMRERKLRNAAGRDKLDLIVCASLIDKIPNLGGLARTSEIFAAEKLVIPDLRVAKMDNFKSLSVGAGDWIDIEECKEEDLLPWLRNQREKGYFIVGLEQTSSSKTLLEYEFPKRPIVLLLGKEKEGIPVGLLQVVDQCIEIPQLGVIRSLNVHVSAAICIWEHRKQKGKLN